MNHLYQFAGSLAAVLVLAGVAHALKLGGDRIADGAQAMAEAEALLPGFEAARATLGSDGRAAVVHGRDGSLALLKLHGAHVAARRLVTVTSETTGEGLRIDSGERRFGTVLLRGVHAL